MIKASFEASHRSRSAPAFCGGPHRKIAATGTKVDQKASPGKPREALRSPGKLLREARKTFPLPHGSTGQARFGRKRPGTWQKEPSLRGGFVGLGTLWNSWPRFQRRALVAEFQAGESGSHNSGGNREEQGHRLKCYVEDSRAQKTGMRCHKCHW